jgi:hypothetical protein
VWGGGGEGALMVPKVTTTGSTGATLLVLHEMQWLQCGHLMLVAPEQLR